MASGRIAMSAPAPAGTARRPLVLPVLLGATLIGTLANNILNVPLRAITRQFGVSVSAGVLVVSSFALVLAAGMALSGWVGDRLGRRRVLVASLALMSVAMFAAALAPTFGFLVATRAVQGLACAAYPPAVMALLATLYGPGRRARMMSAWAAANGLGQAIGPPVGGALADAAGWRAIFWVLAPCAAALTLGALRGVPHDAPRPAPLDWPGAAALTAGAALLMTAATALPQPAVPGWLDAVLAVVGAVLVGAFVLTSLRAQHPIVPPRLIVESRFLRSAVAAGSQMFCLATALVAVPLYLTGTLRVSTAMTGLYVLALPATMAVLAPVVGVLCDRTSPRWVLRAGLLTLAAASFALGWYLDASGRSTGALVVLLIAVGAGVALVQTPAATGATRSPAGQHGAALGLFNMVRFGGSALGAAWVAIGYPHGALLALFGGCAVVAAVGLAISFAGPDPLPVKKG